MDRKDEIVMICPVCGGRIVFKNSIYVCENCNIKQAVSFFFENTEVFIAYVESDEQGRRTKDSVIAQDLYNKLKGANIYTFYQRISITGLVENDFKTGYVSAINSAKAIIVLACSKENFKKLWEENRAYIENKKILPVYAGLSTYDIPAELAGLQAINYNNIGAAADLIKNILQVLGRENELDVNTAADKKIQKRKKTILVSVVVAAIAAISFSLYAVFGTPYILKSKKYDFANNSVKNGEYIQAINIYSQLTGYKDADNLLKNTYNKYNGYYENSHGDLCLTIQIVDNMNVEIACEYEETMFSITTPLDIANAKFEFVDTRNNQGNGTLHLTDSGIDIEINSMTFESKKASFSFDDKIDRQTAKFDKKLLLSWLSGDMSVDMLQADGYDLEFKNHIDGQLGTIYTSQDSPIEIFVGYNNVVTAVSAPATILSAERIGQEALPYLENDTIYVPYGTFPASSLYVLTRTRNEDETNIKNDTTVFATCQSLVDEGAWRMMLESM